MSEQICSNFPSFSFFRLSTIIIFKYFVLIAFSLGLPLCYSQYHLTFAWANDQIQMILRVTGWNLDSRIRWVAKKWTFSWPPPSPNWNFRQAPLCLLSIVFASRTNRLTPPLLYSLNWEGAFNYAVYLWPHCFQRADHHILIGLIL